VDNTRDYAGVSHSRQWSNYYLSVWAFEIAAHCEYLLRLLKFSHLLT